MKYESFFGLGSFGPIFRRRGFFELTVITVIASFILFGMANKLMELVEKLEKPKIMDHFRQSALFYILLITWLVQYLKWLPIECEADCQGMLALYMRCFVPILGIVMNIAYLSILDRKRLAS